MIPEETAYVYLKKIWHNTIRVTFGIMIGVFHDEARYSPWNLCKSRRILKIHFGNQNPR